MSRRERSALVATALIVALGGAAACSSTGTLLRASGAAVSWQPGQAQTANGSPPDFTAVGVCGSSTETFLTELLHVAPTAVKVLHEWGDIVPGGKQVLVSGKVATTHLGPTDLPTSHAYGDDLSMDVSVDPAFLPFNRSLGKAEAPPDQFHVEISSGFIPHHVRPSDASAAQTWRQLSDFNLTGFQPGFDKPSVGDPVLVMGRWIVDCGHGNYATELHPMAFLAWGQRQGNATVTRAYYNPYRDTEMYSPDASKAGKVDDTSRFTATGVKPFPPYLVDEVIRVATSAVDRLRSQELIDTTRASPAPWQVCAPPGTSGYKLQVRYDIVARPGVQVSVVPDKASPCVTVTTVLGQDYRPADANVRNCPLPWSYLAAVAHASLGGDVDVKALIQKNVPAALRPRFDQDPVTTCGDALAGPDINPSPTGQALRVDATQPFPFYGVITAELTS